ncbi:MULTISPECIES: SDR family oxidoreductase [unclassified Pseudomonas]|uniref:UDP-glucose 4-epimerase family protein n=1 Tax=unclassified Pseudomonas TaxID=196821 RepID=UPI002B235542|nr:MULTISPECIES: SDR family oxidoreductase [unclassified Pseudomonas]MEA9976825.1 SDR family oxidoreductase [Pseudomonas sp. RTS4]MEB0200015.1 SDR family oxidoreductase [Pseudomonas sp. 5S4]MEB0246586.1 SDR family oxidoreductase [Pseudomonas sp. 10S5]
MRVVLTGASGFVGGGLIAPLLERGHQVTAAMRSQQTNLDSRVTQRVIEGMSGRQDWQSVLAGQQLVIHVAARVHVMNEESSDPLAEFRKINVEGTLNLARQAASAGVKRFIFISSIKVNGEGTTLGASYIPDAKAAPSDPYGISKLEAEQGLQTLAAQTGIEVVIIRPVLVYGPGVQANFLSMMRWLSKGVPLPLGAINNRRSLVALDNLIDLIVTCVDHPAAANQAFLVSDGDDMSTTMLLRRMGSALNKRARLLPVPSWMLEMGATLLGKQALAQRLCGSLQVDISKTRELLGWTPPVSVEEALRKTAKHFLDNNTK